MAIIFYQGIPGSFTYLAAVRYFGLGHTFRGTAQFREIFASITKGRSRYGVIPVENSLAGSVYDNYDLLFQFPVQVVGEVSVRVSHYLLGNQDKRNHLHAQLQKVTKVYSHPKALEQCMRFLWRHPRMERIAYSDTASAAQYVADQHDCALAAIASREAAKLYGLTILASHIEDNPHNFTRFFIIARKAAARAHANKCSVLFTLPHVPGSLHRALGILAQHRFNLMKIESRPIHGKPFEYLFTVEFTFRGNLLHIQKILVEEFKPTTASCKVLGLYRKASLPS